jgi:hypothetical protein
MIIKWLRDRDQAFFEKHKISDKSLLKRLNEDVFQWSFWGVWVVPLGKRWTLPDAKYYTVLTLGQNKVRCLLKCQLYQEIMKKRDTKESVLSKLDEL